MQNYICHKKAFGIGMITVNAQCLRKPDKGIYKNEGINIKEYILRNLKHVCIFPNENRGIHQSSRIKAVDNICFHEINLLQDIHALIPYLLNNTAYIWKYLFMLCVLIVQVKRFKFKQGIPGYL